MNPSALIGIAVGLVLALALARVASRVGAKARVRAMRASTRRLPERFRAPLAVRLSRAEINLDPEGALRWWAAGVGVCVWFMLVAVPPLAVPGAVAAVIAGPAALMLRTGRADRAAGAALPAVLDNVVAQMRAGGTVHDAVHALSDRPGPLAGDFRRLSARLRLGASMDEALGRWGEERPVPGVQATAGALAMVTAVGGSAATPLEGLAASLRDDETAAGEARALSAQARMSAVVVGVAPLGYLAFATATDPESSRVLVSTTLGQVCLALGLGLEALAALWMRVLLGTK